MRFATHAASALVALLVAVGMAISPAFAGEQPYSPAALKSAQAAGKPVVVEVTASWCSVCAAQKPVVHSLINDPKYKNFVLFNVDFDGQKPTLRKLNVQEQSTLIIFKGSQEVARSTGDTSKGAIEKLFDKAS